jgi:CBS domain-containing protein
VPEPALTVAAAMRPKVPSCTLRTPVIEVARRMDEEGAGAMVVASAGSDLIAGMVTELDLLRAVVEGRLEEMASDIMSMETPPTVPARQSLDATVARMRDENIGALVVVDGDPPRPVGLLSLADIASWLARR